MRASSSRSNPSNEGCRCVSFAINASAAAAPRHAVTRCATISSRSIEGASCSALFKPFNASCLRAIGCHGVGDLRRDQRHVLDRRVLHSAPLTQRFVVVTSFARHVASQNQRANGFLVGASACIDRLLRIIQRAASQRVVGELAVVMRDGNVVRFSRFAFQAPRTLDRLQPLALHLINAQQRAQRIEAMVAIIQQLHESVFGTIEQTRLQIILP